MPQTMSTKSTTLRPECQCGHSLAVPLDPLLRASSARGFYCPVCDAAYEASPYEVDGRRLIDWHLRRPGKTAETVDDLREEIAELKAEVRDLEKQVERLEDGGRDHDTWKHERGLVMKALGLGAEWNVYEALGTIRGFQGAKR